MLRYLHLSHIANVSAICWLLNLISWHCFIFLRLVLKVALAPISKFVWVAFILSLNSITITLLSSLNLSYLLFRLSSLDTTDVLVLLLCVLINFTGALVTCFAHLLPHDLTEGTVASTVSENAFRFFLCLLLSFLIKPLETWLAKCSYGVGLPLNTVKCVEHFAFAKKLLAARGEYIYHIIHFDSLIEDACHKVDAVGSPLNANAAVALCFPDLCQRV